MTDTERIGRFEVLERLWGNAFSLVYRGRDPFVDRNVQIKVCVAQDEAIRRKFLVAAEDASQLRHTNIARVFEFGSGESKPYLVQEAFSERSLADLVARTDHVEDILKLYYLVQVGRGLAYAHGKGVLHRELRPASILVHEDGRAKITDFGTARLASAAACLGNGAHRWPAVGWLVPELLLGLELDARSDIYGFGALSYELMTGSPPFAAESLSELVPQVLEKDPAPLIDGWPECPPELDEIINRCLRRDPGQRYSQMDELLEEMGSVIPVPDPDDIEEEEKTIVTADVQTIFVAEKEEPSPVSDEAVEPINKPGIAPWIIKTKDLGRLAKISLQRAVDHSTAAVKKLSLPNAAPQRRWRPALMVALAAILFGVVGWSLVRTPDRTELIAVVPAAMPAMPTPQEINGKLIIDAQPWAEIKRLVNDQGEEIELPDSPYTPLPIELPPGLYRATLQGPSSGETVLCEALVSESGAGYCRPELVALAVNDYFRETGWWQ